MLTDGPLWALMVQGIRYFDPPSRALPRRYRPWLPDTTICGWTLDDDQKQSTTVTIGLVLSDIPHCKIQAVGPYFICFICQRNHLSFGYRSSDGVLILHFNHFIHLSNIRFSITSLAPLTISRPTSEQRHGWMTERLSLRRKAL